jgi:HEAT repeat protein
MSRGLAITFDLLTTTPNEAAVDVLLAALNSSRPEIRLAAMRSLIARPSPTGHREILRRVSRSDELLRRALAEGAGFMEPTLRQALTGPDWKECFAACQIVLWSREYDLLPALLALMPPGRAADHPHASLSRTVTLQLAELLFEELHGPRSTAKRRDPQACRGHAVASLERWLRQAAPQPNREVVEAYVTLSHRDDAGLRQILHDPHDPSRDAVLLVLGHSRRTGVLRLLASFIDDPHSPLAALRLISGRGDVEFVTHLLNRLGDAPSAATAENLRRIETLAWAIPSQGTLDELDGEAQRRALAAILTTSLSDAAKFRAIEHLVYNGQSAGSRAAVAALAGFRSPEATTLVLRAAASDDPHVQAAALAQVRQRNVPGAIPLLVHNANSPHEVVRQAVRDSLSEFRFERFMATFDTLSDEVRHTTGALVKQIDPEALGRLRSEMTSPSRLRRLRAVQLAEAMGAAKELESELAARLGDEDYLVRTEASRLLATCDTATARAALAQVPVSAGGRLPRQVQGKPLAPAGPGVTLPADATTSEGAVAVQEEAR